jgi:hypothetical protein
MAYKGRRVKKKPIYKKPAFWIAILAVVLILLLVGWDVLRRKKYEKEQKADTDALLKELEELRAQKAKQESNQ